MELPTGNERYFRMSVEEFDTEKLMQNAARQRDQRKFNDMLSIDVDAPHYETESMKEIVEFIEDPVLRQLARSAQQIAHLRFELEQLCGQQIDDQKNHADQSADVNH